MVFLIGPGPIRRTLQYLKSGKVHFKDRVKIMEVHYNVYWRSYTKPKYSDPHVGLREFYFWDVPQIQYMNPNVQIVRFLEMTPLPFIRCWLQDGTDVLFDCDSKDRISIVSQLNKILGKSEKWLQLESTLSEGKAKLLAESPAIFGYNRPRFCMCEVPDQVPCPGVINLPMGMRGKFQRIQKEKLEEWESNLDMGYPTPEELEKEVWRNPPPVEPVWKDVKAMDQVFIRKPPGGRDAERPLKDPDLIAADYDATRFDSEADKKLFDDHK